MVPEFMYRIPISYIFWPVIVIIYSLLFLFWAMIWRRHYIDVEALSFPMAEMAYFFIAEGTTLESKEKPRLIRNKMLWVGFLIGIIVMLPQFIPDISMKLDICGHQWDPLYTYYDLTKEFTFLPNSKAYFHVQPMYIGLMFLFPLDVTFTMWVWYIAWAWFGMAILTWAGIIPDMHGTASQWFLMYRDANPDIAGKSFFWEGPLLGLGIAALILGRRSIA
jgi:hypothetical protein